MLHSYACRITYGKEVVKHIAAIWALQCEQLVAFEHTDTAKIHCHLLIINSRVEKKQLRNLSRNCGVDVKGNANMSFKAYDSNETYLVYMTKGQFSPFYLLGFTQDQCEEAKKQWVPPKERDTNAELYVKLESCVDFNSSEFRASVEHALRLGQDLDMRFDYVKRKAHTLAFVKNKMFATGKFFSDYKMLVYTYCFRNNIIIPKDWKGNY